MRQVLTCCLLLLVPTAVRAVTPSGDQPDAVRRVPPPGVAIPPADRAELEAGVAELGKRIDALRASAANDPKLMDLLPDVQIYWNAVHYALAVRCGAPSRRPVDPVAAAEPSRRAIQIRRTWGVTLQLELPNAPRHVLEEEEIGGEEIGGSFRWSIPSSPHAVFSLATADGRSALGSTFFVEKPDPGFWRLGCSPAGRASSRPWRAHG